ncbi:MAG: protein-L-isoaspartate O-methyltransferase [Azoarcus sp.]|jgi:protein-L-isoaspartate(D-aspartate) O-methyltransferase|nr:protein-L-isoaspartate O-methyltransferase [Azoarcus sp.]
MNFEHARFNMVEQQLRPWGGAGPRVRHLLMTVRREDYVPPAMRAFAFADIEIPLPGGQTMFKPAIEGRILQTIGTLHVNSVLEIGTGSGYFAALLAANADHVHTVEIDPELARLARDNLVRNGVTNVTVEEGDASQGWYSQAPYDVIVVSGGLPELPEGLLAQLKPGGRLFAFTGTPPAMKACIVSRNDKKTHQSHSLFETVVPMLRHIPQVPAFNF